jgi:hypothetical protein
VPERSLLLSGAEFGLFDIAFSFQKPNERTISNRYSGEQI